MLSSNGSKTSLTASADCTCWGCRKLGTSRQCHKPRSQQKCQLYGREMLQRTISGILSRRNEKHILIPKFALISASVIPRASLRMILRRSDFEMKWPPPLCLRVRVSGACRSASRDTLRCASTCTFEKGRWLISSKWNFETKCIS